MAGVITSRSKLADSPNRSTVMQSMRTSMIGVGFRDARKSLELYGPPRRPFPSPIAMNIVQKSPTTTTNTSVAPAADFEASSGAEESPAQPSAMSKLEEETPPGPEEVEEQNASAATAPVNSSSILPTFSSWPAASDILDLYLSGEWTKCAEIITAPIMGKGIIAPLPIVASFELEETTPRTPIIPTKRARDEEESSSQIEPLDLKSSNINTSNVEEWRRGVELMSNEDQEQADRQTKRCKLESELSEYYDKSPVSLEFPAEYGFRIERSGGGGGESIRPEESAEHVGDDGDDVDEMHDVDDVDGVDDLKGSKESGGDGVLAEAEHGVNKIILDTYVFEPSSEVFQDFENFVRNIELSAASRTGVVKVIVPKDLSSRSAAKSLQAHPSLQSTFKEHIDNTPHGRKDGKGTTRFPSKRLRESSAMQVFVQELTPLESNYELYNIHSTKLRLSEPKDWVNLPDYPYRPKPLTEKQFLKLATFPTENGSHKVWYSTDNNASKPLRKYFSLKDLKINKFSGNVIADTMEKIEGIHTPFLYFARKYTCFAMHIEDYGAHSINYMHAGSPKRWIVCKPSDTPLIEKLVRTRPDGTLAPFECSQFVRHQSVFIPTSTLRKNGIRYTEITQREGEMIITFPFAYHQGWNTGRNCAEAVAYGNEKWRSKWVGAYEGCRMGVCCDGEPITFTWES